MTFIVTGGKVISGTWHSGGEIKICLFSDTKPLLSPRSSFVQCFTNFLNLMNQYGDGDTQSFQGSLALSSTGTVVPAFRGLRGRWYRRPASQVFCPMIDRDPTSRSNPNPVAGSHTCSNIQHVFLILPEHQTPAKQEAQGHHTGGHDGRALQRCWPQVGIGRIRAALAASTAPSA